MPELPTRKLSSYFASRKQRGEEGLPVLSVTMRDGLVPRDQIGRKTDSALAPSEHLLVEPGDIAYNMMRMWQGALGLAEQRANVSPAYGVMRPKLTVDPRFAAHWFKSDRGLYMLWAYSYGLTDDRLRLYPDEFLQIPVQWPEVPEQRRIAEVLDAWDGAIERSEQLKVQRDRSFKTVAASVFNGWTGREASHLGNYCRPRQWPTPGKNRLKESGIPAYGANGLIGFIDEHTHVNDTIAVGCRGSVGEVHLIRGPAYITGNAMALDDLREDRLHKAFLFHFLKHVGFQDIVAGSSQAQIVQSDMRRKLVWIASIEEQTIIGEALDACALMTSRQADHAALLRRQKRGLMQKLLTGEWRVPESVDRLMPGGEAAERLGEAAAA